MELLDLLLAIFIVKEQLASTDRMLGMLPITFACLAVPIIVQVLVLFLWAIKWKPPSKEASE